MPVTKVCRHCAQEKSVNLFYRRSDAVGYRSLCKSCYNKDVATRYYPPNRERINRRNKLGRQFIKREELTH